MMQLLTIEEAAARLRIRPRTVQALLQRGQLTRIRPTGGKPVRIAVQEVEALLERARLSAGRPGSAA
jgi:excisionase family DNA binding protein